MMRVGALVVLLSCGACFTAVNDGPARSTPSNAASGSPAATTTTGSGVAPATATSGSTRGTTGATATASGAATSGAGSIGATSGSGNTGSSVTSTSASATAGTGTSGSTGTSSGATAGASSSTGGEAAPGGVAGEILWLRADRGLDCELYTDGRYRVATWYDQSGRGDDAIARDGKPGPLCGQDAFPWGAFEVPYFADDNTDDASLILDVDLTPLLGSDYTLFVVERRRGNKYENYMIGTLVPQANNFDCSATGPNPYRAVHLGYRHDQTFTLDEFCDGLQASVPAFTGAAVPHVDVGWFSQAQGEGQRIYVDGVLLGSSPGDTTPLRSAQGGAIGRGYEETADERFIGDIAEVVVYPRALDDAEREAVEADLRARWGF